MATEGKYVIAVVDDDPLVLQSLDNLLQSVGYTVRTFSSAAALLAGGGFASLDCLISDVHMPVMDGIQLADLTWRQRPELPIILMTGCADSLGATVCARRSNFLLFRKPIDPAFFLVAVNRALAMQASRTWSTGEW